MATTTLKHAAPDAGIEQLLAEIASTAYLTEQRLKNTSGRPELHEYEVDVLRDVVARLGWMADVGLKRLDSINCMQEGDAAAWLLSPAACETLATKQGATA